MLNDVEMLNDIRKNVQMGCKGIDEILPYAKSEKFRKALETQKEEYGRIFEEADQMLHERGENPESVSAMAKISSKTMTMMKTMKDPSEDHLAEMMYQGSAMGVTKIIRHQREYSGSNPKIIQMSERLLKTEESNMAQMRKFL
jgi:organic radical activating enzyme